jgi:maltose alpha-D-glucosyltransferase/alpha-amylase
MTDDAWYTNAILYEVYARSFCDSNGDGQGDLPGLTSKLDYLRELGVTCLWLPPVYPSPLLDGGYDIADFRGVHPDFGTLDDLRTLLREAHARGLRVIADLVLNHTASQHPWFQAARRDRRSPFRDYYVWSDTDRQYAGARIIFLDTETSNWTWDPEAGQFYWHRFYSWQPDLNYDNPAVRAEMQAVMQFWLDLGLDGFRADAVPYLFEREGTNCENLPETHAYLKEIRRFMDERYPGRVLLAEANQWPHDLRPYFGDGDEFHMAFHFPVMPRIFMALAREDAGPIVDILKATPPIPPGTQWCTFLRNHDELTLEMVTEAERQWMWQRFAPEPRMRLNLGIRRRLAPLLDGDRRRIELAHALLFALPGTPIFYYGDEIGMGDNIRLNDRDGVRTPMQWDASPNAGFSTAPPDRLYLPVIDSGPFSYQQVNVAAQMADPGSLWNALRRLAAARKAHPAFGRGQLEFLPRQQPGVLGVMRRGPAEVIVAVFNLTSRPQTVTIDLSHAAGLEPGWLGRPAVCGGAGRARVSLAGRARVKVRVCVRLNVGLGCAEGNCRHAP